MFQDALARAFDRAGIPFISMSFGDEGDRATWRVEYPSHATAQQRAAGDALLASYDYDADTVARDERAAREFDAAKALKAAVLTSLWGRLGRQPTANEINAERTRFLTIYKAL